MNNAIEVMNLKKHFGTHTVIDGLDFQIKEGDFFGLLGRNGAGKSTLINVLTGVYHLSSGNYKVFDVDFHHLDKVKHKIGVMPDISNLYNDMNAYEFIKYMASLKGIFITRKEVLQLMENVGLENSLNIKIKNFSFGMKKKICIAQAILGDPALLFLDEPTSGVDPESIIKLQNMFMEMNKIGITILIASHNLQEIQKLCNKLAILKKGKFAVNGELNAIIDSYENKKVFLEVDNSTSEKVRHILSGRNYTISKNRINVEYSKKEEIPLLVEQFVQNRIRVYSVERQKTTLEEIFMQ